MSDISGSLSSLVQCGSHYDCDTLIKMLLAELECASDVSVCEALKQAVKEDASGNIYLDLPISIIANAFYGDIITTTTLVNVAAYTLLSTDDTLLVIHTVTAPVTITLPTVLTTDGRTIVVKDSGGNATLNNITVATEGAETIDGAATAVIATDYDSITLVSDGTDWFII